MTNASSMFTFLPERDCQLCPRLVAFRSKNRGLFPDQFNAPVPAFGPDDAQLMVLGLAPGLKGANFTGRPFTGDYAGDLLYSTLLKHGFARGAYDKHKDDGLELVNCRITNAVRCVPPENKPTTDEENTCRQFLVQELAMLPRLKIVLTLGLVAHKSFLKVMGEKQSAYKFTHGGVHNVGGYTMVNSYHCSRYNTQTGRLTTPMFHSVFDQIKSLLA